MRKEGATLVFVAALCAGWVGVDIAQAAQQRQRAKAPEVEFVCYTSGKLTERHVGVASAEEKVSGPAWKITYVEGGYAIYAQREGESCQIEEVSKATK